jgi:hypothetical protein
LPICVTVDGVIKDDPFYNTPYNIEIACLSGIIVGTLPGLAKECLDLQRGYEFSTSDLAFDILGATSTALVYYIVRKLIDG